MQTRQVFYQCQRCGNCCRWPGFVRLTSADLETMAAHFDMNIDLFVDRYTELNPDRSGLVLKNKANGECCFLEGHNTCTVQSAKPFQCQGFPNTWNFQGWQDVCEALPVITKEKEPHDS